MGRRRREIPALLFLAAAGLGCEVAATSLLLELPDSGPPPAPDAGTADAGPLLGRDDGSPCRQDRECAGGSCIHADPFSGGYCTLLDCRAHTQCDRPGGQCVTDHQLTFCAVSCGAGDVCRAGYECINAGRGPKVCLPDDGSTDREDGEPCTSHSQCRGRTCFFAPDWPEGHCTTDNCSLDADCASHRGADNRCVLPELSANEATYCARACQTLHDCRPDYACVHRYRQAPVCLPDMIDIGGVTLPVNGVPGELICTVANNGQLRFDFEVPAGTRSYMATPFTRDGRYLFPLAIQLPSGARVDFSGANAFQTVPALLHGFINPTVVPAVPQFADQLEVGLHTYELESASQAACLWLQTETTPGTRLDLRFYFVGTSAINAVTAPSDPDMNIVVSTMAAIYANAGLMIGDIRYRNVPQPDATAYRIIRSMDDMEALMRRSEPTTLEGALTVNVFWVQGFGEDLGLLGIASSLPGPAGIHSTSASGVVVTAEFLGQELPGAMGEVIDGDELLGNSLAHEVGHYLGLFHTSEAAAGEFDPILDTPECPFSDFPFNCRDRGNLMFPFADPANRNITADQSFTMLAHPLTKD